MYPPNHAKVPPVRPRSSLSTDEHHRIKDTHLGRRRRKEPSNALLTLAGFCIFLFVLCAFLLGALVYVGRQIAEENAQRAATNTFLDDGIGVNLTDADGRFAYAIPSGDDLHNQLLLSTKPIVSYHPAVHSGANATTATTTTTALLNGGRSTLIPAAGDAYPPPTLSPLVTSTSKVLNQLSFRLPRELRPKQYRLRLQLDLKAKTYSGNLTIRLEVLKPIAFIALHSKHLSVSTDEVRRLSDQGEELSAVLPSLTFEHPEREYWVTEFAQPLAVGDYALRLRFNSSLTNRIVGFYQSSYFDEQRKEKRWIATSKFEPTFARQAFPCFDEPSMKATFQITVVHPTGDGYHALSNMNIANERVIDDRTEVSFAESVPMSTYLVCFIVSDLAQQSKTVNGSVPGAEDFEMRVFSTPAQVNKVTFALDTGVAITEYYIKYFNVSYALPKLDMAAIPDFVSGAMEHWGLITYRETALLFDESVSSSANKQRVAVVVAHELAHMWFGNLVTMKWWSDLWLNEGFASYIEYKGVNAVYPEWQMLDQFLIEDLHKAMKLDATLASHPIVQVVDNPSRIFELFDSITYSKGASVIRMLEDLVGEAKFRNATENYLNKFVYESAETDDFLTEIEAQEFDYDIKLITQTWIEQMGLPVVEVTQNGTVYKLTQKRFLANPEDYNYTYGVTTFNYRWSIPITYFTSAGSQVQRTIFNYNDQEITINVASPVDWIKVNKNQMGYYRVNYPPDVWRQLTSALISAPSLFSVSDRAHLLNDAFALADAAQLNYSIALNLTRYLLSSEHDYVPWSVANSQLKAIRKLLYLTAEYREFVLYARQLLSGVYESVSWNVSGDHLQNLLRVNILSSACEFGHAGALEEAAARFRAWLSEPQIRPSPDLRSVVYKFGMQVAGNEHIWDKVWHLFTAETDAQEKLKLMKALASIKIPWILKRYIDLAWNEDNVRRQDYFTCLRYISKNPIGQSLVWDYVRENWPALVKRFGLNDSYLGRLIPSIAAEFSTQTKLEEMRAFFAKYPVAGAGEGTRAQAEETVKYKIKWLEHNKSQISQWLAAQKKKTAAETDSAEPEDVQILI